MKKQSIISLALLSLTLFGFQNCSDMSAAQFGSKNLSSLDSATPANMNKLYYYYEKTSGQNQPKESYEVLFDLEKKKAELSLQVKESVNSIKQSFDLSDDDVYRLKSLFKDLKVDKISKLDDLDRLENLAEEYVVPYFSDDSAFQAYLDSAKELLDSYQITDDKELISRVLNEIIAKHSDLSVVEKFVDFLDNREHLESLIKELINKIKDINVNVDVKHSGNVTLNGGAGKYTWKDLLDLIF